MAEIWLPSRPLGGEMPNAPLSRNAINDIAMGALSEMVAVLLEHFHVRFMRLSRPYRPSFGVDHVVP